MLVSQHLFEPFVSQRLHRTALSEQVHLLSLSLISHRYRISSRMFYSNVKMFFYLFEYPKKFSSTVLLFTKMYAYEKQKMYSLFKNVLKKKSFSLLQSLSSQLKNCMQLGSLTDDKTIGILYTMYCIQKRQQLIFQQQHDFYNERMTTKKGNCN